MAYEAAEANRLTPPPILDDGIKNCFKDLLLEIYTYNRKSYSFHLSEFIDPSRSVMPFLASNSLVLPRPSSSSWTWLMKTFLILTSAKAAPQDGGSEIARQPRAPVR
jgi:hypothetical protein